MYRDLRTFVDALEKAGQLLRVTHEVDPVLEVAAIADLASKAHAPGEPPSTARRLDPEFAHLGGPAILFENVKGSACPLLVGAYGSYQRMAMALGAGRARFGAGGTDAAGDHAFEGIATLIGELATPQPPRGLREAIAKAKQFAPLLKVGPKRRSRPGKCQQVVRTGDDIDLTTLPILRCWPVDGDFESVGYPPGVNDDITDRGDTLGHPDIEPNDWDERFRGRYITLAGIHTIHPDDEGDPKPASHNIGMYRVQLFGKRRVAMHWHMHHDGARHWRAWKKTGRDMPVAIALGGESVLPYAATAPLPPGISELLMAGFLHGSGVEMVRAKTVPLWVPANAEIVIEGWVSGDAGTIDYDPRETDEPLGPNAVFEGPFGDHTGFYSMPDRYPLVKVTAVTHRKDPIYPTTVVGLPPQEDYFLGKATERLFRPLLQVLVPDIEDYDLPMFGAFHNCSFIKIKKAYPMQARRVMHAIWGAGQMAWTKTIFVVDDDVDVHDTRAVLEAAARRCCPVRDIETVRGPVDILDHAAPRLGVATKLGFDCTRAWPGEEAANATNDPSPEAWSPPDAGTMDELLDEVRAIDAGGRGVLEAELIAPGWIAARVDHDHDDTTDPVLGRRVATELARVLAGSPERSGSGGPRAPFGVVVGRSVDLSDPVLPLFHWMANADHGRDRITRATDGPDAAAASVWDATPKLDDLSRHDRTKNADSDAAPETYPEPVRPWPPILRMPADVTEREAVRAVLDRLDSPPAATPGIAAP